MARSKWFTSIEKTYQLEGTKMVAQHVRKSFLEMTNCLSGLLFNDQDLVVALVEAAKLGISSRDGSLAKEEKEIVDETFSRVWDGDTKILYDIISRKLTDDDYGIIVEMCHLSSELAVKFTDLVLGFAYIDGYANERILNRIDTLLAENIPESFGKNLMDEFPVAYKKQYRLKDKLVELIENDAQKRACVYKKIKCFLETSHRDMKETIGRFRKKNILLLEKKKKRMANYA